MNRYALIDGTGYIWNVIIWNGSATVSFSPYTAISDPSNIAQIAGTWNGSVFLPPVPGAPYNVTATPSSGQVILTWTIPAGATSFNIYQGTTPGGESTTAVQTGVVGSTITITGLTNGTTYYFKIAAVNSGGTGPDSEEVSATP